MDPAGFLQSTFILPILLASISLFLFLITYSSKKEAHKLPPGPPKLPIIGNLHQLSKNPHISLHNLSKKYGPIFHLQLGQISTIILSSAKMAKEAMKTHDISLATRPQLFAAKHLFYNCTDVAFAPYGPHWIHVRKICNSELFSSKRVQSYGLVREEEVAKLVHRIEESCNKNGTTNLTRLLNIYANAVLCRAVFGTDFSVEYERFGFHEMLNEYQELLGGFSIGDFFPSLEFLHTLTGHKQRLMRAFQRFDQLFSDVIKEKLELDDGQKEHKDFVDILLEELKDESAEAPLTMDNVKAILLDMFAAGTDTTFITLDWAMTELIRNPTALKKAQSELRNIVGQNKLVSENDHLPHLHYLKSVIKETYRLHPPVPVLLPRESMQEITIGDFKIPEKTRVFINAWSVGRNPESWYNNPEMFEPQRFMGSEIDFRGQDFELIPFGAGRRICPGMIFGSAVVEIGLAQILHSFDWELPHGVEVKDLDMSEVFGISMPKKSPLIVVAKPYDGIKK
ncbi:Cytochrome P450 CYP2 subfamily [Handroanthus impetiginosus]|uniref:Cytochrome P450 CYP2 subfamily n=1 Tax=Handroanthus impetiginosus TaxID=429701 RepID=A0A2G9I2Z1_9LAMI|nr:Cytochrome P450 CYP2 subfamily [Handroanthus impetiginosus]